MADANLDRLKLKYQSVLNTISTLGVDLQNLHLQDDKLVIRGRAKTRADSNQVWEQVKLVDANYAKDLSAQFTYESEAAAAATPPAGSYTVQKGDTLSEIAKKLYGQGSEYQRIFEANRDQLSDPDKIQPGQVLRIPS